MIAILAKILGYGLLAYAALVGGLYLAQRDMMYFPGYEKPVIAGTGIIGIKEIKVRTQDGLDLFGWYKAPRSENMPTILWFHGNASNVGWAATGAIPYVKQGYGVLLAEYRGYSTNPGKPSENGIYQDARAFMQWLKQERGVEDDFIILYGESIGSGPAVQLAMEHPGIHTLVLVAPMTNVLDLASARYPFMPAGMLLKDRYDNLAKITEIESPLIVVHGERDSVIPYAFGKRLFDAAPEPKSMITIQDGDHNDLAEYEIAPKILSLLSE